MGCDQNAAWFCSTQQLKMTADAAFGPDSSERTAWFEKWRYVLRHDPKGVRTAIDELRCLKRMGKGNADIFREFGFFHNDRKRMGYNEVADAGYPIGSGVFETGNPMLVNS